MGHNKTPDSTGLGAQWGTTHGILCDITMDHDGTPLRILLDTTSDSETPLGTVWDTTVETM